MLEKNKDYFEMRVSSTDCAFTQNAATTISIEGFSYDTYFRLPDPGESYVIVSKEKFEKLQESVVYYMALSTRAQYWKDKCEQLQADDRHYRELAKQFEENYNLLLENTGFTSVADLIDYICDPSMTSPENKTLKEIIDECEKDYISERDKAEALQTENEQLKKKLHEFDPFSDFKELFKKLHSIEDTEALEWALNHTTGGRGSVNGWRAVSSFWSEKYKTLSKLVGFSSTEEIQDYLTNEAECDTLQEAVSKLKDQVKYTCDEWYSANSRNNSWKAAAECNSPKELIEKRETIEKEIDVYSRALQEWKEITGYPSPSEVKTALESGASWCHAYNEVKKANEKLADDVKSWKNVTGYSTPESFLSAKINDLGNDYLSWKMVTGCSCPKDLSKKIVEWEKILTPHRSARDLCSAMSNAIEAYKSSVVKWLDATGCDTPEAAKKRINGIISEAEAWESDYNHLLALTGFDNEGEIEDFLEQNNDRNKLTTVFDNLKLENEAMKAALRASNIAMQKELDQEIDKWQKATGRTDPEAAKQYIDRLKGRLNKIHGYSVDW